MAYIPKTVYFSPDRVRAIMDQLAIDDKKLAQLVEASTATIWLRTGANQWKYVRRLICLEELLQKLPGHEVLGLIQQHITNETIDGLVTSGLLNASSVRAPWMGVDEEEQMEPITFLKFHPPLYEILEGNVSARTLSKLNEYLSINSTRLAAMLGSTPTTGHNWLRRGMTRLSDIRKIAFLVSLLKRHSPEHVLSMVGRSVSNSLIDDFVAQGTILSAEVEIRRSYTPRSEIGIRIEKLLPAMQDTSIAKEVGCSRELVRQARVKSGIPAPWRHEHCEPDLENKLTKFIKLSKAGLTAKQMALALKIEYQAVLSLARKHGITLRSAATGPRAINLGRLVEHMSEGGNYTSAARELGVSLNTVCRWAKKLGLETNAVSVKGHGELTPEQEQEVLRRLQLKDTAERQIALTLGITPKHITDVRKKHNLDPRRKVKRHTSDVKKKFLKAISASRPLLEVCAEFNVPRTTACAWIKKLGIL